MYGSIPARNVMRTETTFARTGAGSSATPVPKARIESIDATRGVALFLLLFSHCVQSFFATHKLAASSAADQFCMEFFNLFAYHKSMMLFALLFGLSFFFQMKKASAQGGAGMRSFAARLGWLAAFGYVNGVFDRTDMLLPFALCGLVLPLLWKLSTRWLLAIAVVLLCHPPELLCSALGIQDPLCHFLQIHRPVAPDTQTSSWLDLTAWNMTAHVHWMLFKLYLNQRVFDITGMFLLGCCLGRNRIFEPQNTRLLQRIVAVLGGILVLGFTVYHFARSGGGAARLAHSYLDSVQTVFYAAFFTLIFHMRPLAWLCRPMAAIGKSTLSCYMAQGVILSFLMFGWGLGWAETMPPAAKAGLAVAIFLLQMLSCILILKKWPLCPMEMLWRRLVAHSRRMRDSSIPKKA